MKFKIEYHQHSIFKEKVLKLEIIISEIIISEILKQPFW